MSHATYTQNRRQRRGLQTAVLGAALALALALAGCSTEPSAEAADIAATEPAAEAGADTTPAATEPAADPSAAIVARASAALPVYGVPNDQAPEHTLPPSTDFGTPTVVLVSEVGTGAADGWLEVLLPMRPNGATGWIRAADVELRDVSLEVEVDLEARELAVLDGGEVLLTTSTAIGESSNPTPTGRFYVTDKLETPDPDGAYGPYALGLSAHSETLTEFGGGDGQVGIHGTNTPSSIGEAVSHGCMRVDNTVIERLAHLLPLGTPVTIS